MDTHRRKRIQHPLGHNDLNVYDGARPLFHTTIAAAVTNETRRGERRLADLSSRVRDSRNPGIVL